MNAEHSATACPVERGILFLRPSGVNTVPAAGWRCRATKMESYTDRRSVKRLLVILISIDITLVLVVGRLSLDFAA
jgi:hypothetical protein